MWSELSSLLSWALGYRERSV